MGGEKELVGRDWRMCGLEMEEIKNHTKNSIMVWKEVLLLC